MMSRYRDRTDDVTDRLDTIICLLEGIDEHLANLLKYSEPTTLNIGPAIYTESSELDEEAWAKLIEALGIKAEESDDAS